MSTRFSFLPVLGIIAVLLAARTLIASDAPEDNRIKRLAERRDLSSLIIIAKERKYESRFAAIEVVKIIDTAKVVKFCSGLEEDFETWRAAFYSLSLHPKEQIIEYVRKSAESKNVYLRYCAYKLCLSSRWPDLVAQARKDLSNGTLLFLFNGSPLEMTIGDVARQYLDAMVDQDRTELLAGCGKPVRCICALVRWLWPQVDGETTLRCPGRSRKSHVDAHSSLTLFHQE